MFMKRFLIYASLSILWGGIVLTGCKKEEVTGEDPGTDPAETSDFRFETTDLTQASFGVTITPEDQQMTYYYGLVSKSDYDEYGGGELLQQANLEYFESLAAENGMTLDELLVAELRSGIQEYSTRLLDPGTEYVFYAYGISTEGEALTDVNTYGFTAPGVEFIEGVEFEITGTDITPTSFTLNVTPNNPDIFYFSDVFLASQYQEYCGGTPEGIGPFVESYLETVKASENYSQYTWPYIVSGLTFRGASSDSESFVNLLPETTYYAFAVGVANDGTVVTAATVAPISTSETPRNEYSVSNERVTDVTYSASVTATQSETFAVMMERRYFFSDTDSDADIIRALYTAHGEDISDYCYADNAYVSFDHLIPGEDYYLLIFACNPDGSPKLDEGKVNLMKREERTLAAEKTSVQFDVWVSNVDRTTATVNVSASGSGAEDETYMFNYMTESEYRELENAVEYWGTYDDMDEALQAHMNEFFDARLQEYNEGHPGAEMDMKEFLSRTLEYGASTMMPVSYGLEGLESGETYYVYLFGVKADGSYTTSAVIEEFTTVADVECAASIGFMYNQSLYGDRVYLYVYGYPSGDWDRYYMKLFPETDEWTGKTKDEVLELLQQEQAFTRSGWSVNGYVNLSATWYCYGVCFDTAGIPTDVYKMSMTVPADGGNSSGDLVPEILSDAVQSGSSSSMSLTMHDVYGLLSPVSSAVQMRAFEPVDLDGVDFSSVLLRKHVLAVPETDIRFRF